MNFADLDEILRIARSRNIAVIEDCAHAHAGQWRGKCAGGAGDFGCFSFQSSKIITAGEGGAVITSSLEHFERAQSYVNCGRASITDQFRHRLIGFNYRMTQFQAAVLEVQLQRLPKQAKTRLANINYFEKRLRGTPGLAFLKRDKRITRLAAYQFVFKYLSRSEEHTSELQSQSNLVCRLLLEKKQLTVRDELLSNSRPRTDCKLAQLAPALA